jgi:hypothetical protein
MALSGPIAMNYGRLLGSCCCIAPDDRLENAYRSPYGLIWLISGGTVCFGLGYYSAGLL